MGLELGLGIGLGLGLGLGVAHLVHDRQATYEDQRLGGGRVAILLDLG